MKKYQFAILLAALSQSAHASLVIYGNDVGFDTNSSHSANNLLGSKITIDQTVRVEDAGIIFRTSGYNANVGLYTSNFGQPDALLDTTGEFYVNTADTVLTPFLTKITLNPGDYWFMAVYDQNASIGKSSTPTEASYQSLAFTSSLPSTFGSATNYTSTGAFNYFITTTPVPIPSAVWLFSSGLLGLWGMRKKVNFAV